MSAYAALVSLKTTLDRFLVSDCCSHVLPRFQLIYTKIESIQSFFQRTSWSISGYESLEEGIRVAIFKLEDVLESLLLLHHSLPISAPGDYGGSHSAEEQLQEAFSEIDRIAEEVNHAAEEDEYMLDQDLDRKHYIVSVGERGKMVGRDRERNLLMDKLRWGTVNLEIVPIIGMAGIGKTLLASIVYEEPSIQDDFDLRCRVRIGPNYQLKQVYRMILYQISGIYDITLEDDTISNYIRRSLKGRRYLILLDDVWDISMISYLRRVSPDDRNGSRIIVTSRINDLAANFRIISYRLHIPFLDEDQSWNLLVREVFGERSCPPELEKIGRKIARNCEGLPLALISMAKHLRDLPETQNHWNQMQKRQKSHMSGLADYEGDMTESVMLSYKYLFPELKPCFLYMAVFAEMEKIPASKLMNLWAAEGFVDPIDRLASRESNSTDLCLLQRTAEICLKDLVSKNLVIVHEFSSNGRIKTCGLHYAFRRPCLSEATKVKLFHLIRSGDRIFCECMRSPRRLCIQNNIFFGIKATNGFIDLNSTAHSLLCTGPFHQYPVSVCVAFKLLRVLDTLSIRFYKFPDQVVELVLLRYLAFTYDGELPSSISNLYSLQYLIVSRHFTIKSSGPFMYLPIEIWNMKELKYLQVTRSSLPISSGGLLPNLITLSTMNGRSCTKEVFEGIPYLNKLGIQIVVTPDVAETLSPFDHLALLSQLEKFKCVVLNPNPGSIVLSLSDSIFPVSLKKLALSGCGFAWADMKKIASLPNLEVLKLKCNAFQGPEWITEDEGFLNLRFLLLEGLDLEYWKGNEDSFPNLVHLIIRDCFKLKEIHPSMAKIFTLERIELVDCSPSVAASGEYIREKQLDSGNDLLRLRTHKSWEKKNKLRDQV